MGFFKDSEGDFVQHEIKTFQRKGDLVRSEYERLNLDGSVTKTVAYGNTKEGLKYRSFQLGTDGVVREVTGEQSRPSSHQVSQSHQQQQQQQQQQHQQQQQYEAPRRQYVFVSDPKPKETQDAGTWHLRPQPELARKEPEKPKEQKITPWWYEINQAMNEFKEEIKELTEPVPEKPTPKPKWFDDTTWFHFKPLIPRPPTVTHNPFDLLGTSLPRHGFFLPFLG